MIAFATIESRLADPRMIFPEWRIADGPPGCWNRGHIHDAAVAQVAQIADLQAELVGAASLLAGIVLHQIRPARRSAPGRAGKRDSSGHQKPGFVWSVAPDFGSQQSLRSEPAAAITSAGPPELVPARMEVLFAELASRRLRSLATRKRA